MICNNCKTFFKYEFKEKLHLSCPYCYIDLKIDYLTDYLNYDTYDLDELCNLKLYYNYAYNFKLYALEAHIHRLSIQEDFLYFNYFEEFLEDFLNFSKETVNNNRFGKIYYEYNLPYIISNLEDPKQLKINSELSKRYVIVEYQSNDYFKYIYILGLKF